MSTEVQKVPFFVEIIGEPESGKTHLACLFPYPALIDTTKTKESYVTMKKIFPNWRERYFPVKTFKEIREALDKIKANKAVFKTVILDTSADLRDMGSVEYLEEKKKQGKEREALMPLEYRWVNEKIDEISGTILVECEMNLVHVAQMKDEWTGKGNNATATGKRIRMGYPRANFQSRLRLFLRIEQILDPKTMQYTDKYKRVCVVIKNSFRNRTDESWLGSPTTIDWKGIKELTSLKEGEIVE
jgi:hypothetical protein